MSTLPEKGPGYHDINIILMNGTKLEHRTVLDSKFLEMDNSEHFEERDIAIIGLPD